MEGLVMTTRPFAARIVLTFELSHKAACEAIHRDGGFGALVPRDTREHLVLSRIRESRFSVQCAPADVVRLVTENTAQGWRFVAFGVGEPEPIVPGELHDPEEEDRLSLAREWVSRHAGSIRDLVYRCGVSKAVDRCIYETQDESPWFHINPDHMEQAICELCGLDFSPSTQQRNTDTDTDTNGEQP
jgi:hypothetical protein